MMGNNSVLWLSTGQFHEKKKLPTKPTKLRVILAKIYQIFTVTTDLFIFTNFDNKCGTPTVFFF